MKMQLQAHNWIVITGNPIKGFTYHGPFGTIEEADVWGHDNFDQSGFYIYELKSPLPSREEMIQMLIKDDLDVMTKDDHVRLLREGYAGYYKDSDEDLMRELQARELI